MKKSTFIFAAFLFMGTVLFGQMTTMERIIYGKEIPTLEVAAPNVAQLLAEDEIRDAQGLLYRNGVARTVNVSPSNSGIWTTLPNGDRQWSLRIKSSGAQALSFLFQTFKIYGNTTIEIRSNGGLLLHPIITASEVQDHFMYNAALCVGDEMVLILTEPKNTSASELFIDRIMYGYRSISKPESNKINESEACEVNVNCTPVGNNWQDEKRGVARILVVDGGSQGWCTGSLINNLANDCKPLFLTALHCGVTASASDFNQWKFYFGYESPNCNNPNTAGTLDDYFITGCFKISDSGDGGGASGSDFLLVQLGTANNQATTVTTLKSANFNAYWNGWDANNTATTGGTGIHHPAGDIKKISTFNGNTVSSAWNGNGLQSHWRVTWSSNANGYGVTEGGSSGSPLFNNSAGRIIGTLTGGGSFCSAQTSPDYYGKISYHWTSNGAANNRRLKPYLDPANTGALTQNGSSNPCANPSVPVANFVGAPTTVNTGSNVSFTDLTTGVPTSWTWTISGGGWAYTGGTSASSQNPVVTFNTPGQYTVTLLASNAQGNDSEVKNNYITVVQSNGPCVAAADTCDEYIKGFLLNTINNNSNACSAGGYADYTNITTTLAKGSAYSATVVPGIIGQAGNTAYTGDEVAVWIDYNNDDDFADAGEQVGYVLVGQGWSNVFNFTVPMNATTGLVHLRTRISYQGSGAIVPCGTAVYGETEDYMVNITAASGLNELNPENVSLYPNPSNDQITLEFGNLDVQAIQLFDIMGKEMLYLVGNSAPKMEVSLAGISKGLYHVKILTKQGIVTKTLIRN